MLNVVSTILRLLTKMVKGFQMKHRPINSPAPTPPPPTPTYPAPVVTLGLQPAWDTQINAGLTSTPTKTPVNATSGLTSQGWSVDNTLHQIFVNTSGSVSDYDLSGYEIIYGTATTTTSWNNCKFGFGSGNRLINLPNSSGAWVANFINCLFDGTAQVTNTNGIIVGPAMLGGTTNYLNSRFQNARRAYMEAGGTTNITGCYFGPVGTVGVLDDGSHCEGVHNEGGTCTILRSMVDQRTAVILNDLTGLLFSQGVNAASIIDFIDSVMIGVATLHGPLPWTTQSDGLSAFTGKINLTNSVMPRGSSGYGTPDAPYFVPTGCLDINTGAAIISGNNP